MFLFFKLCFGVLFLYFMNSMAASRADDPVITYYGRTPTDIEVNRYWDSNDDNVKNYQYYYTNGIVKHRFQQGGLCGEILGIEENFSNEGTLVRRIKHKNYGDSCSTRYSIKEVEKYSNGLLSESFFLKIGSESNYACKCGMHTKYSYGKRMSVKKYPSCSIKSINNKYCYELD